MTCDSTKALDKGNSDEITMLKKIAATDRSHNGSRHVMEYYETFDLPGPHGLHKCIVTEVLGISLDYLRREGGDLRLGARVVKTVIRQVLLGLDYLHNSCGIVHAGATHSFHLSIALLKSSHRPKV
jgi:serine/threonine-protein kinase SRPK3